MVLGWRKAFCTSIPKSKETSVLTENQSPKPSSSRFGFFSNPSTPRLKSPPESNSVLRCKIPVANTTPTSSIPNSPKLQCKTSTPLNSNNSPRFFQFSNPSTPKSPSSFAQLFKSSRIRCGICIESLKSGQGTAIFTAECSHSFHFPCIAGHVKKHQILTCPICGSNWKELAFPPIHDHQTPPTEIVGDSKTKCLRVYNDDEPLMSPSSVARFNPIPESNEDDDGDEENDAVEEFQGFFPRLPLNEKNVDVSLLQETVMVTSGHGYETYAVVLKVKAPPCAAVDSGARRAPIDLVTVIDVSGKMTGAKMQMMKRSMRLIISSLSSSDRLSIVAYSASSKRLMPLRRMTTDGRRSARRIVDAVGSTGQEACPNDALKKAVKIIEDRRDKNPVTRIVILSDGPNQRHVATSTNHNRQSSIVTSRFAKMEIPVHLVGLDDSGAYRNAPSQDNIAKSVGGLLSVVVQDLRIQLGFVSGSDTRTRFQISAVYSLTGRPEFCGSGSVKLGDLYAEEERELLVEFKVPASSSGSHQLLTVRSSYKDPSTQKLVYSEENTLSAPTGHAFKSTSNSGMRRLKNLHVFTRAVAESRILIERNDLSGAYRLLSSAKALLIQSNSSSAKEFLPGLEVEMAELHRRRQLQVQYNGREAARVVEEKSELLTPTSAWRAAERLAKLAIIRKSMNRVSDLHGFENARF